MNDAHGNYLWWQEGIIYQIYPRSYQDSNGDGVGDLRGIISRLPHLKWLGVTAVWLSPIYPSPMADFGYDISDYVGIHPLFGTMEDFDALLAAVHDAGLKLVLDLVPNHTSEQHPWFLESKSSRDNPKRDWYIWKDARADGSPPNNWLAQFGGPAWKWDETTGQYFYHAFTQQQPDLNWRNPEVQTAMLDVMRFWLDKGVDGFRVDVIYHIIKDEHFRDNPPNPNYQPWQSTYEQQLPVYSTDQPEVLDIVMKMRALLDTYTERLMIGEIYLPIHRLVTYYGTDNKGAHLPFNFLLIGLPWQAPTIAATISEYEGALPHNGWPNWVIGNHDQPRIHSRVGRDQARIAAILLLTLRGTPTIYYGEEISMRDVPIPANEVVDPPGLLQPEKNLSRDPARTPMQWNNGTNAGFTDAKPWLRLDTRFHRENVESEKNNPYSMLSLYKRLIELRQNEPSLKVGRYTPVHADQQCIAYIREAEGSDRFLILLNLSHKPCYFKPQHVPCKGVIELASSPELEGKAIEDAVNLSGDEGVVIRLEC